MLATKTAHSQQGLARARNARPHRCSAHVLLDVSVDWNVLSRFHPVLRQSFLMFRSCLFLWLYMIFPSICSWESVGESVSLYLDFGFPNTAHGKLYTIKSDDPSASERDIVPFTPASVLCRILKGTKPLCYPPRSHLGEWGPGALELHSDQPGRRQPGFPARYPAGHQARYPASKISSW